MHTYALLLIETYNRTITGKRVCLTICLYAGTLN